MKALGAAMLASAVTSALLAVQVQGTPLYKSRIPNGDNVPGVAALGHVDIDEDNERNVFGIAFEEAGMEWTVDLCQADSDEDGQTNGQELGDPCCYWIEGDKPLRTTGLSHPGDASKTAAKSQWANLDCEALQAQAEASREAAKDASEANGDPEDGEDSETEISTGKSTAISTKHTMTASTIATAALSVVVLLAW